MLTQTKSKTTEGKGQSSHHTMAIVKVNSQFSMKENQKSLPIHIDLFMVG